MTILADDIATISPYNDGIVVETFPMRNKGSAPGLAGWWHGELRHWSGGLSGPVPASMSASVTNDILYPNCSA